LNKYIADLQSKVKNGEEVSVNLTKIKADFQKRLDDAISAKDKEVQERDGALQKHLVSDAAARALAEAKGSVELLLPHVKAQCKVVRNEDGSYSVRVHDEQGDARTNSSGGWMTVAELVAEMKLQTQFSRAFESEVREGNRTTPGSLNRPAPKQGDRELSSVEKIRAGLKKGQFNDGRGRSLR
jgi:hypothetical protein